jgi:hypothetical protein
MICEQSDEKRPCSCWLHTVNFHCLISIIIRYAIFVFRDDSALFSATVYRQQRFHPATRDAADSYALPYVIAVQSVVFLNGVHRG